MEIQRMLITPSTTVHQLLVAYPELEDVLIEMAPPFEKLRNPFLRKSVAKVATISHIASVAGLSLDGLIKQIRAAVGQATGDESYPEESYFSEQPDWFAPEKIVLSLNEEQLEEKDVMPLVIILREAKKVQAGEIIEFLTTYLPAPGIDLLKARGYSAWIRPPENGLITSYFLKNTH